MKKLLVVILAMGLLFSFGTVAMAADFTDMSGQSAAVKDGVNQMVSLGIVEGYPDNTFKPDGTITRAEFAKIACIAAGLKEQGEILKNTKPTFTDVKTGEWYTGWINLAAGSGYLKGYENNTFRPNQTVTNQEVITVLLRLLGYDDNLPGTWPQNYVDKANGLRVLENVNFVAKSAATRGQVAVMTSATLNKNMVNYSKEAKMFVERQLNGSTYTLLESSFGGQSTTYTEGKTFTQPLVKDIAKKTFTADGIEYNLDTGYTAGFNLFNIEGHQGKVMTTKDGSKKIAKQVEITSKAIQSTTAEISGSNRVKLDKSEYYIADYASTSVMRNLIEDVDRTPGKKNTYFTAYIDKDGEIYSLRVDNPNANGSNPGDALVDATYTKANKLVQAVSGDRVTFVKNDYLNLGSDYLIIKDGKSVTASSIKAGDVLTQKLDNVYMVTTPVKGKLERYVGTGGISQVTVDGITYKGNNIQFYDSEFNSIAAQEAIGKQVQFALNTNNSVTTIVGELAAGTSAVQYGVVTDYVVPTTTYNGDITTLEVVNQNGSTTKYNVKSGVVQEQRSYNSYSVNKVQLGSVIEYRLDDNNTIVSLTNMDTYSGNYMLVTSEITTSNANKRLTIDGSIYSLDDNVVIFDINASNGRVSVSKLTPEKLLAYDSFIPTYLTISGGQGSVPAKTTIKRDGSAIKVIAVTGMSQVSGRQFGFIKSANYGSVVSSNSIMFYGDNTDYDLGGAGNQIADSFVEYSIVGKRVTINNTIFDNRYLNNGNYRDVRSGAIEVESFQGGLLNVRSGVGYPKYGTSRQLEVSSQTKVYTVDNNGRIEIGSTNDIGIGSFIQTARKEGNGSDHDQAAYIIVVK